jgi:hypothetical protein
MSPIGTQVASLALNYALFALSKRLDLADAATIRNIEIAFYSCQALIILILFFIRMRILRKQDLTPVSMPDGAARCSVMDYDLSEVQKALQSQLIYLVFMSVLHFKWQFVKPLIFQTLPPLLALLQGNLAKAHIWPGQAVQRPFKVANPLEDLLSALQPAKSEDEKAKEIEQVEDVTEQQQPQQEAQEITAPKVVKRSRKEL